MFAGIIGLVGVALGALATGGVQLWLERKEASSMQKVAARLLLDELTWTGADIETTAEYDCEITAHIATRHETLLDVWVEYRSALARSLNPDSWLAVSIAVQKARHLFLAPKIYPSAFLESIRDSVRDACNALSPHC